MAFGFAVPFILTAVVALAGTGAYITHSISSGAKSKVYVAIERENVKAERRQNEVLEYLMLRISEGETRVEAPALIPELKEGEDEQCECSVQF